METMRCYEIVSGTFCVEFVLKQRVAPRVLMRTCCYDVSSIRGTELFFQSKRMSLGYLREYRDDSLSAGFGV